MGTWAGVIVTLPLAPTITLSSSSGQPGEVITITGDGFTADSDMTATFDGLPITLSGTPHTDANGHFTATFVVPSVALGLYSVTATDNQGYSASAQFSITPSVLPENPLGALAPVIAIAFAFILWGTVKRSKNSPKQFLPF
ncbi:MAG: IPT/TIG domain-containing protein [Chloroflexi bacterium]|nr:IPT/TIG domain-containing protein [Chloroflexota bacterium]MCL5949261.1 IPT/TIG domain-containing protein [Candidatus Bathyarchaeota archaeon]